MSTKLCVIPGCRTLGEHLDDCSSERCKGCRPRYVESGFVCNSDRTGLQSTLDDIRDLDAQLREEPDPLDHDDWRWLPWPTTSESRYPGWRWWRGGKADDPLARVLPMGIVASSLGAGAKVSGSKEPAAPTDLDRLDLIASPRAAFPSVAGRANRADQIGQFSVVADLDLWVRDWRKILFPDQHLPAPTVPALVKWIVDRLGDACDHHLAIDEFATEMLELRRALRGKLGLNAPPRQLCHGVFCKSCDLKTMYREGGLITCGNCGLHYSEAEYRDWVALLNADAKRRGLKPPERERPERTQPTPLVDFPDWVEPNLAVPDSPEVRRLVA